MRLVKCPRCDLNYILDTEKLCKVCLREMKGSHVEDEMEMCSVCNAAPALPGRDVCLSCLKEMTSGGSDESIEENTAVVDENTIGLNSMSSMDEIIPDEQDDIPSQEYGEMEHELSLEEVREDEEREALEDEEQEQE